MEETQTDHPLCSTCGTANAAASRFCNNCGAPLGVPSSAFVDTITQPRQDSTTQDVTTHDKLSGRDIDGRYRIENLIGVGGMGSVYRATRIRIGDEVAIKILHTERVTDPQAAERFQREAQAAARLKHPNAVSIYDFGISSDGLQYLVMELVEGESLRQLIKEQGTLDPVFAAEITAQACAALDEAHRHHIVHRDVKPDNIVVNATPGGVRVKVLDFGIAKLRDEAASHLTQTGSVMGTPHYMSPEQCLGEELDARADIYSMGIVLYEMLCGRVPFNSPISTAVVVQHVNQPPSPLRSFNPNVSQQLEWVVLQALQKQRDARPRTAGTFARALMDSVQRGVAEEQALPAPIPPPFPLVNTEPSGKQDYQHSAPREQIGLSADMPPTVHLASLAGITEAVPQARATSGNGTVSRSALSPARKFMFGGGVLAVAILLSVVGFFSWRAMRDETGKESQSGLHGGKTTANSPTSGMVRFPGGTFLMGSSSRIQDPDSKPQHSVVVKPFFLDTYEVTCLAYKKCVDEGKCSVPKGWTNGDYPAGAANHPVTGVSWEQANTYAHWSGKRLPSEEEWEFAASGTKGLLYPWGNQWKAGCANADNVAQGLTDVGNSKCDSPYDVADLIGNAWEWTSSNWAPYPNGHITDSGTGNEKVIRGGSWQSPKSVTSTFRLGLAEPGDQTGFRCAKDAEP